MPGRHFWFRANVPIPKCARKAAGNPQAPAIYLAVRAAPHLLQQGALDPCPTVQVRVYANPAPHLFSKIVDGRGDDIARGSCA
jgi:hypothetical protein